MNDILDLRRQRLQSAIYDPEHDEDIVDIDNSIDPKEHDYNTYASRFYAGLEAKKIKLLSGTYENHKSVMQYECEVCGHTWPEEAAKLQRIGCPECRQFEINLKNSKKLWDRSKKIIRDKGGKIVKLIEYTDPDHKANVDDAFVLKCRHGHTFTFSHRHLYRDAWCPICRNTTTALGSKETSDAVYQKRLTNKEKYLRLRSVAEAKGSRIITPSYQVEDSYELVCTVCGVGTYANQKQILSNYYLCPRRCVKGNRFNLCDR